MTIRSTIETWMRGTYGPENVYVYHRDHADPSQDGLREFAASSDTYKVAVRYGWWWRPRGRCLKVQFGRNGSESDLGLDLTLFGLHWFARVRHPRLAWARIDRDSGDRYWFEARHTGFYIGWAGIPFGWEIDVPENMGVSSFPEWRRFDCYRHRILGRQTTGTTRIDRGHTAIPMPEGDYFAVWETSRYIRTYQRWPGKALQPWQNLKDRAAWPRITFEIRGGIPHWGKGENPWDGGMDATYSVSMNTDGHSPRTLARMIAETITYTRERTGPFHLPHPMTPAEAEGHLAEHHDGGAS